MDNNQTLIKANRLRDYLKADFDIYLKREDLSYYGSHKGRSIPVMINHYYQTAGITKFTISSSGNAALAAAIFARDFNLTAKNKITLKIFIGKNIPWHKARQIKKIVKQDKNIFLSKVEKPRQASFQLTKNENYKNLRQSTDNIALIGYENLAGELSKEIKNLSAIFVPTSSGTTAVGLYLGFKKIKSQTKIFFVQTDFCHPFVESTLQTKKSLAGAIVDIVGHRKTEMQEILKNQGMGFVATDCDIKTAIKLVKKTEKIKISPNSALAIVGLAQAIEQKKTFSGPVVCLLTGE